MKKYAMIASVLLALSGGVAYASNYIGLIVSICGNHCTPVPTPTPSPTPTPQPGGGCTAWDGTQSVDPNLNAVACNEFKFLYNQERVGSSGHMMQAAQIQFGNSCFGITGATDCQTAWNTQTSANTNNLPLGMVAVDPCSINQAGAGTRVCSFGPGSTANQMAKIAWNAGAIVNSHMDATNPIVDWNNLPNPGSNITQCAGGGAPNVNDVAAWGTIYDCNNNSGESWTQYVTNMIKAGTTENSHWNTELNNFATSWIDLQNAGVVVVLGPFQEWDGSAMWHAEGQIAPSLLGQVELYDEHYWESQGIHNLIYMNATLGGTPSNLPGGCGAWDMLGWDSYANLPAGPSVNGQYSNNVQGSSACGKKNIPQGIMEYETQRGAFDNIDQNANPVMPNEVFANVWSIGTGGRQGRTLNPPGGSANNTIDPSWPNLIRDNYTLQISGVAARR